VKGMLMLTCRAVFVALTTLLWAANATHLRAQDISCNQTYTTEAGDTLSGIAERAYGRAQAYQRIFDFNPGKLESPNLILVGVDLYIPCEDGGERPDLPPIETASAVDDDTPSRQIVKILTGAEYAPYVDDGLENGGFSFELVERALQFGSGTKDYRIDVINDWSAHLKPLLADGAYDLAFPWFKPDCSQREKLGEMSQWRCDMLRFSVPLHEVVITFYGRQGGVENIKEPEDAHHLVLCRPSGYFTHDLEVMGLVPPNVTRVRGESPTDCFERLIEREVDLVSVNADTSDRVITELGIRDKVSEIIELATIQTLHVVGMKTNPRTRVLLLRVNKGLKGLREEGTFVDIAAKHLVN